MKSVNNTDFTLDNKLWSESKQMHGPQTAGHDANVDTEAVNLSGSLPAYDINED